MHTKPSRWPKSLSARFTYTLQRQRFVSWAGSHCEDRSNPGSVSEDHPGTTKCPEPLCLKKRSTVYQRDVVHLLRGHYPSFIARTDSCARPVAFTNLWPNLVPVIFAGCYRPLLVNRSFPTLSLRVLPKMPGPLPRRFAGCTYLLLPLQHRPSPKEL